MEYSINKSLKVCFKDVALAQAGHLAEKCL